MDDSQRQYYNDMISRGRGYVIHLDGKLVAVITFFIGFDDNKYMHGRDPWTILEDEDDGDTIYIDQLIASGTTAKIIHKQFGNVINMWKKKFPTVQKVKWSRAPVDFRKHKVRKGRPRVYCKNIE